LRRFHRVFLRHDDHAIVVGHYGVARLDIDARADDRNVHRAGGCFHRAFCGDRPRPHREAHLVQRLHVAAAGVDDQSLHPARVQRGGEQFAEHAVGIVGGAADHQDVALSALFDGDMDHPVVTRLRQHGHRGAGNLRAGPDRPQVRFHQSGAAERLMYGRDAQRLEGADGVAVCALDVTDDDGFHDGLR
jgi:hypothetical protein